LKPFIEVMKDVDFITTMGAGCHAHPKGTKAGAKALVQAKEFDKAAEFIEKLNQEAVARDVELLGSLGLAYLGLENKELAKQTFADLLKLAPDNSKALAFLTALTVGQDIPKAIRSTIIISSLTAGSNLERKIGSVTLWALSTGIIIPPWIITFSS